MNFCQVTSVLESFATLPGKILDNLYLGFKSWPVKLFLKIGCTKYLSAKSCCIALYLIQKRSLVCFNFFNFKFMSGTLCYVVTSLTTFL